MSGSNNHDVQQLTLARLACPTSRVQSQVCECTACTFILCPPFLLFLESYHTFPIPTCCSPSLTIYTLEVKLILPYILSQYFECLLICKTSGSLHKYQKLGNTTYLLNQSLISKFAVVTFGKLHNVMLYKDISQRRRMNQEMTRSVSLAFTYDHIMPIMIVLFEFTDYTWFASKSPN